jgi:hypothetical protein
LIYHQALYKALARHKLYDFGPYLADCVLGARPQPLPRNGHYTEAQLRIRCWAALISPRIQECMLLCLLGHPTPEQVDACRTEDGPLDATYLALLQALHIAYAPSEPARPVVATPPPDDDDVPAPNPIVLDRVRHIKVLQPVVTGLPEDLPHNTWQPTLTPTPLRRVIATTKLHSPPPFGPCKPEVDNARSVEADILAVIADISTTAPLAPLPASLPADEQRYIHRIHAVPPTGMAPADPRGTSCLPLGDPNHPLLHSFAVHLGDPARSNAQTLCVPARTTMRVPLRLHLPPDRRVAPRYIIEESTALAGTTILLQRIAVHAQHRHSLLPPYRSQRTLTGLTNRSILALELVTNPD